MAGQPMDHSFSTSGCRIRTRSWGRGSTSAIRTAMRSRSGKRFCLQLDLKPARTAIHRSGSRTRARPAVEQSAQQVGELDDHRPVRAAGSRRSGRGSCSDRLKRVCGDNCMRNAARCAAVGRVSAAERKLRVPEALIAARSRRRQSETVSEGGSSRSPSRWRGRQHRYSGHENFHGCDGIAQGLHHRVGARHALSQHQRRLREHREQECEQQLHGNAAHSWTPAPRSSTTPTRTGRATGTGTDAAGAGRPSGRTCWGRNVGQAQCCFTYTTSGSQRDQKTSGPPTAADAGGG